MLEYFIVDADADFFHQTSWWADIKSKFGWEIIHCECNGKEILLYIRKFAKLFSLAYVPFPNIQAPDGERYLTNLMQVVNTVLPLLPKNCICVRIDTSLFSYDILDNKQIGDFKQALRAQKIYKGQNIQPPDTVLLNLEQSEDELLAGMKPKWRYNIRLAQKKGITIKESLGEDFEIFWKLYLETAKRDAIAIHSKAYYESVFKKQEDAAGTLPQAKLWTAWYNKEPISAIITVYYNKRATYLYGASSNEHRNVMAPYLLQWSAIMDAQRNGCTVYDMYGISPKEDPEHPMAGLYRFKTGFGGTIRHYAGCVDIPVQMLSYKIFAVAEKARLWWYKSFKKKIRAVIKRTSRE